MLRSGDIDLSSEFSDHPDNSGLVAAFLGLPGLVGGQRWPDATGRTDGLTFTTTSQQWSGRNLVLAGPRANLSTTTPSVGSRDFLIAATINPSSTSLGLFFATNGTTGNNFWCGTQTNLQFSVNGGLQSGGTIAANTSYRVCMTRRTPPGGSTSTVIYLNGRPVSAWAQTGTVTETGYAIGAFGQTGAFAWSGLLTDFRFHIGYGASDNWAGFDNQWSLAPETDPRIRRLTRVATFLPLGDTVTYRPRPRTLQRMIGGGL